MANKIVSYKADKQDKEKLENIMKELNISKNLFYEEVKENMIERRPYDEEEVIDVDYGYDYDDIEYEIAARQRKTAEEKLKDLKSALEKVGGKLITDEKKALEYLEKEKKLLRAYSKIMVEVDGKKMTAAQFRNKYLLSDEGKQNRKKALTEARPRRKIYVKPSGSKKYYYFNVGDLKPEEKKEIFKEVIDILYPSYSTTSAIVRILSSGAGTRFAITNYPRIYSSKVAFKKELRELVEGGYFDDDPEGWKAVGVLTRRSAENKGKLVEKLNTIIDTLGGTPVSENDPPSVMFEKYRDALAKKLKDTKSKKQKEFAQAKEKLQSYLERRKKPIAEKKYSEAKSGRVKLVAQEFDEDLEDLSADIEEYGADMVDIMYPVNIQSTIINGLVIGFATIATIWISGKLSDIIGGWISKWTKIDEKYIKALAEISAGIVLINSHRLWKMFMREPMPIQGVIVTQVVGWTNIANGIYQAIRGERLVKITETIDAMIDGFVNNIIGQKPEKADASRLMDITSHTEDDTWRVAENKTDEESITEELEQLLPTPIDETQTEVSQQTDNLFEPL